MNEWFGLGLVFNFQDRASSGISRMTGLVNNLSSATKKTTSEVSQSFQAMQNSLDNYTNNVVYGSILTDIGSSVQQTGLGIMSMVKNLGASAFGVGKQFENWRMSLTSMYGSLEKANEMIDWGLEMAVKTPFEIEDVIDGIQRMKASGIEANKELTALTPTGEELTQNMLMFASDLAALRPEQGMQGAIFAMQELLGDHDSRSIKSRFGISVDWDFDNQENLEQQFADKVAQMAGGLTDQLANTVDIKVSNLNDIVYSLYKSIADAGWFEAVKSTFDYFYEKINTIDLAGLGETLADTFMSLWKPIDTIVKRVVDIGIALLDVVASNPAIAKMLVTFVALAGAVVTLSGTMLVLKGLLIMTKAGFDIFKSSLNYFADGLLKTITKLTGVKMSLFGLTSLIGGLYLVWKTDFGGIRTMLQNFMNNVYQAFKYASQTSKLGATEMIDAVDKLNMNNVGDRLKYKLLQLSVLWDAVCESWNDNSLSEETFKKVEALGLLPLLSKILDVKYGFERFVEGFISGWQRASDLVAPVVEWLGQKFWEIVDFLFPVEEGMDNVGDSADEMIRKMRFDQIEKIGEAFGTVAGVLVPVWLGFKALNLVLSPFIKLGQGVWGVLKFIFNVFTGLPSAIGGFITALKNIPTTIFTKLKSGIETVQIAWLLLKDKIALWGGKLWGFISPFVTKLKTFASGILPTVTRIGGKIWGLLVGWGSKLGSFIWGVAGTIGTALGGIPAGLVLVIAGILIAIGVLIYTHWGEICDWWNGTWENIKENWNKFKDWCGEWLTKIGDAIKQGWQNVCDWFSDLGEKFKETWSNVCQWWSDKVTEWSTFWSGVWEGIKTKFSEIIGNLKQWWSDVCTYWSDKFNEWKEGWSQGIETIKTVFSDAIENIKTWWSDTVETFKTKVNEWKEDFNEKIETIKTKFIEIKDNIATWWSDTVTSLKEKGTEWKENFTGALSTVGEKFSQGKENIKTWWGDTVSNLKTKGSEWRDNFGTVVGEVGTKFSQGKENIKQWWGDSMTNLKTKGNEWKTNFSTTLGNVSSTFSTAKENIKKWWSDSMTNLKTKANDWKSNFATKINEAKTNFSTMSSNIKSNFTTATSDLKTKFTGFVTNSKTKYDEFKSHMSTVGTNIKTTFSTDFENMKTGLSTKVNQMKSFFTTFKSHVSTVTSGIKTFFSQLGTNMWTSMKSAINKIIGGFNSMINGLNNKLKFTVPDWVPGIGGNGFSIKIPNLPYLNTGGYIKGEGISYLHPNEVVINDELTQKLRGFLNSQDEENTSSQGSQIVVRNVIDAEDFKSVFNQNDAKVLASNNSTNNHNDNSVTFSEGAIQITVTGANSPDYDAEKLAEMIMEKIKRKNNVKRSLNYVR